MAQVERDTRAVNTKVDSALHQSLGDKLKLWGYHYRRQGSVSPWWGAFIEAIANGVLSDDGEYIIFRIPYKKG